VDGSEPPPGSAPPALSSPTAAGGVPARLPPGYREGFLTAITVLLGFSLAFVRFWGLETPGAWTAIQIVSALVIVVGTALQLLALFRSLRLADDEPAHYRVTVRVFLAGVIVVMLGVFVAIISEAQGSEPSYSPMPTERR
jgi:hypothetical protein